MEWMKATSKEGQDGFTIPDSWLHLHYYEALNILFRIENGLRVFVYLVLKNEQKDKWADITIASDDEQSTTIGAVAKRRRAQAENFGYLGYSISCPLLHLTSGELIRIITAENYWKWFAKYFPGTKEIMRNKLDEIGTIRNTLAHFRPLKADDVELLKQNAKHVLPVVEELLDQVTSCDLVVPTNTKDVWYKELKSLGNDFCSISLRQSANEDWLKVTVSFSSKPPVLNKGGKNHCYYQAFKLKTPAILKAIPALREQSIFISEDLDYAAMPEDFQPAFSKQINFVFSRKTIESHHKDIKKAFRDLFAKIANEGDLIKQDNLAKGALLELVFCSATLQEQKNYQSYWSFNTEKLSCPIQESDPSEYWGSFMNYRSDNFISHTTEYPWMPTPVSNAPF